MALRHYVLSLRYGETYSLVADGADLVMEGGEVTLDVVPAPPLDAGTIIATAGVEAVTIAEGTPPSGGVPPYRRDLYRSTTAGQLGSLVESGVTLPYEDRPLTGGVTVYPTVRVLDSRDESADTPQVSVTPEAEEGDVEPFFADSFETGDRSHSANGFAWGGTSSRVTVSSERARTGAYSLKFDYSMGSPEQRFSMGQYAEIWFEFWVWLPGDYAHPNSNPGNNKFFMLWGENYEHNLAPKVGAEYWPSSGGPNSYLRPMYDRDGDASTRTVPEGAINPWIGGGGVMIPGQWNRIRIHAAIGTSGNLDGVYQFWTNDDLTYSSSTLDIYPDGTSWPYFDAGYFLGSAGGNPGAAWFIDDVKFYDRDPGW